MPYRALARVLALLHTTFALFVVAGSALVLRFPQLLWVHLGAVAWALATMVTDLGCILTSWEKALWRRGGREPYQEGFVQHHLLRRTFAADRSQRHHALLGIGVVVLNAIIYLLA